MRRLFRIATLLFVATLTTIAAASATDREHTLKIYNWADYIDEEVLVEFQDWYKEQTGEEVEVIYLRDVPRRTQRVNGAHITRHLKHFLLR